MKQTINSIYHAAGGILIALGFIACIEMAGDSDLGMELSQVIRCGVCGILMMATGLFLTRWKV